MVKQTGKAFTYQGLVGLVLMGSAAWAPPPDLQEPSIPLDRWLVSEPFAAGVDGAAEALETHHLEAESERALFPDRDVEVAGTYWHLVRDDSSSVLDLDARFPNRPSPAVTYAHAYIRSPSERTMRLRWGVPSCAAARLRLNSVPLVPGQTPAAPGSAVEGAEGGREREERAMAVRLAAGWNTLLAAVAASDCPYRVEVRLEPVATPSDEGDEEPSGLEGLQVQASRPPGVRRTFPRAFVTAADATVAPALSWATGDADLRASLWLALTPWGAPESVVAAHARAQEEEEAAAEREPGGRRPRDVRGREPPGGEATEDPEPERLAALRERLLPSPPPPQPAPQRVELELEVGGRDVERVTELDGPGRARTLSVPVSLDEMERAVRSGSIEARLRWRVDGDDRRVEGRLPLASAPDLDPRGTPITLTGWTEDEGGARRGEWRVPGSLSGRSLELLTPSAPGRYAIDGRPVQANADGRILLCEACEAGRRIRLTVAPDGPWSEAPTVRVVP